MPKGFSDLFGILPASKTRSGYAVPVFIETKVHPNKPSKEQIEFLQEKCAEGCAAGVAYNLTEAWGLIAPHLKPEHRVFTKESLERWDKLGK